MEDTRRVLYGYDLDEVDEIAAEVFTVIAEAEIPTTQAVLALCKAITLLGTEEELDLACVMIDQLRDIAQEEMWAEALANDEDSEV